MKTFKEHLTNDFNSAFFNEREFAEKVVINDLEMTVVLDNIKEKKPKGEYEYGYTNHIEAEKLIILKYSDYELIGRPSQGERLILNGESFEILDTDSCDGIVDVKVRVFK
ncbi:hypothetical protein [Ilyobacter polytropus]|uniref:Uncharacterized protein n=1 Tax=Ilyobacter polytropus (strain ATCC 51220 / DSM 2926 / LMG 16218 / CuHBu1) TaxID=572544 RepID=E3H7C2_ILYPC|nr:hypothetical protein [Ilyobacter polytropus]ADO82818.1 conserved hypothetical protein [Ilyobacter polytropus DSM 2926]